MQRRGVGVAFRLRQRSDGDGRGPHCFQNESMRPPDTAVSVRDNGVVGNEPTGTGVMPDESKAPL